MAKRNILIPVDDTQDSVNASEWAIQNVYRDGDEFHLLSVIPAPVPAVVPGIVGVGAEAFPVIESNPAVDKQNLETAKHFIEEKFLPRLAQANIPYEVEIVRFLTDNESIGEVVCKRAEALNAELVVIAKHAGGRIKEFFLGSVTNHLVHHCKAPVAVLHG